MRTLKFTLMATLALAFSVATAQAASVDIIWQGSGTGTTTATSSTTITGDIVLTIGTADTAIGGVGAGLEISADSSNATILSSTQATLAGWMALGAPTIGNPHSENIIGEGDLFGSGATIAAGTSVTLGTITVHVDGGGATVLMGLTGVGDDIIASTAGGSVAGQYTFGGGQIIPEPTTASLLGLGLIGLTMAGRRRS